MDKSYISIRIWKFRKQLRKIPTYVSVQEAKAIKETCTAASVSNFNSKLSSATSSGSDKGILLSESRKAQFRSWAIIDSEGAQVKTKSKKDMRYGCSVVISSRCHDLAEGSRTF